MTFSIAAWDPSSSPPEWGVAVASKFLAVGSAVPWVRAGAGAVATQAFANLAYGPEGLERLAKGAPAQEVVDALIGPDEDRDHRQLGIVDSSGGAATFTGPQCFDWAGGRTGDGYTCQGNILTGPDVVDRMAEAFEASSGELAARLLVALRAGDEAGGDRRGRQSAALYVARAGAGYGGGIDRSVDLRVEDHPQPVPELERLFGLHRLYFPRPEDLEFVPVDGALAEELRAAMSAAGYEPDPGSGYRSVRDALFEYVGSENLEERWTEEPTIEAGILDHIRRSVP
jgi:uncharacterized Ntn-hydrolase superfamily protein